MGLPRRTRRNRCRLVGQGRRSSYPLRVFDLDCAVVAEFVPGRAGGTLRVEGNAIVPVASLDPRGFLPYDARCAAQMPRVGVPSE